MATDMNDTYYVFQMAREAVGILIWWFRGNKKPAHVLIMPGIANK